MHFMPPFAIVISPSGVVLLLCPYQPKNIEYLLSLVKNLTTKILKIKLTEKLGICHIH